MAVERTPFTVEDDIDDKDKESGRSRGIFEKREEQKPKLKKPEALGILAVEPKPEPEKVLAKKSILAESYQPASEAEAPTDSVGKGEARAIVREMVMAEQQADAEEPAAEQADPKAAAAEQAVEHFRNLIVEDEEDLDTAYTETLAEMGVEPESEPEPESDEDEAEAAPEVEPSEAAEIPDDEEEENDAELRIDHQPEADISAESEPDGEPEPEPEPSADGGNDHDTPKAENPRAEEDDNPTSQPPAGGSIPPSVPMGIGFGAPGERNPDLAPPPSDSEKKPEPEFRKVPNAAAAALLGGIVGYLIGRRRGRIKTEKRLLPIQKKLEKEVNNLQWEVKRKEAKIRAAAARRYESGHPMFGSARPGAERLEASRETVKPPDGQRAPEHIGHMLLASEARPEERRREAAVEASVSSKAVEKNLKAEKPAASQRIDTLNRAELMALGEKITIEGSNLRQMYETHLIGERGLRRLVGEHLAGGDLQKALRNEVLEREMDFERDPVMRDLPSAASAPTGGGTAVLDKLLEKAAVSVADSGEEAAFFKARARYEAVHQQQQHKQQRRIIDISLVIIITSLVGIVVAMYLTRG